MAPTGGPNASVRERGWEREVGWVGVMGRPDCCWVREERKKGEGRKFWAGPREKKRERKFSFNTKFI